jgi:hypothetical protein
MRAGFPRPLHRTAGVLLAMVFLRSLVPAGFMPDLERPFALAMCPDGFPAAWLAPALPIDLQARQSGAHDGHGNHVNHGSPPDEPAHGHATFTGEHCAFGAASGLAPAPHATAEVARLARSVPPLARGPVLIPTTVRHRIAQPRAPPALT